MIPTTPRTDAQASATPTTPSQHTADQVRALIMSGALAPGDRIVENRLAPQLGVSRPPLREALRLLEQEGLVVQEMFRGARVVSLTRQDVYEIVTLRRVLETTAIHAGVPVRDASRLDRVRTALQVMEQHAAEGNESSAAQDSYALHLAIVGLAGNSRLDSAYRSLGLQLMMGLNRRARLTRESLSARAARHRAVVDEIERGQGDVALALLHDDASLGFLRHLPSDGSLTAEATEWFDAHLRATSVKELPESD
jgi:DNA-binding GntR family transcriptional regulator